MGGVKNRDAKRAANKVFSSGGGGGAKGPSVIDKRGQEMSCPHCDRVFKQAGRLQDHIKKQHAEVVTASEASAPGAAAVAATVPATALAKQVPAKPAGAMPGKGRAPPAAAQQQQQQQQTQQPKMMEIGSKAGAYDRKSPKLLLHEWCLSNKQPKPRYKTIAGEGGTWRAKVVLPDVRNSDKDVVVFLDQAHAAGSEEEAMQAAAVAALHRVAGNRRMDSILPPSYVSQWRQLDAAQAERIERAAAQAARREAQEARAKAAARRQGPATVYMTDDKRRLVEGIIADIQSTVGSGGGADDEGATEERAAAVMDELVVLGFSASDAEAAVGAAGAAAGLATCLDWLCLNVPEEQLPANFAPGAAGKPIGIIRRGAGGSSGALGGGSASASASDLGGLGEGEQELVAAADPAVSDLMQYGYPAHAAAAALQEAGGHMANALAVLFGRLAAAAAEAGGPDGVEAGAAGSSSDELGEWAEERVALEGIYGPDVVFHSERWTELAVPVSLITGEAAAAAGGEDELVLHLNFWAPTAPGAPYPARPPTLGVRSEPAVVAPVALLTLTRALAGRAAELAREGHPMVFELATAAVELLPDCLLRPLSMAHLLPRRGAAAAPEAEHQKEVGEGASTPCDRRRHGDGGVRHGGSRGRGEPRINLAVESRRMQEQQRELETSREHAAIRATRAKLPAAAKRGEVLAACAANRVVVVSGATGCGKSTQVPQYLLEQAIANGSGATCNIICTQPRRIAAIGLASRVAAERGEQVGATVGYSVRLDSKQSARTRLLFCTTGILLRRLLGDPSLQGLTHVVLDEVHERTIESDLLLLLLRDLLTSGRAPGLRVVLMSATADAQLFASYFEQRLGQRSGQLSIPGFTHPVTDLFLEDALEHTGFLVGRSSKWAKRKDGGGGSKGGNGEDGQTEQRTATASGNLDTKLYSEETRQSLQNIDETLVNSDLIEALVAHVVASQQRGGGGGDGAILIFAPGVEEISRICRQLAASPRLRGGVQVLPLHGGLPPSQQSRVFQRPPKGTVKVVVSTNVAETSLTIDDITCVIDTGRVKEMGFDTSRGIARLQETWVSQASAQQRRGRAGRVRPGTCYRLYSRRTWGKLARDTAPEIARAPLQGLVLDVKGIMGADADVAALLAQMITPPAAAATQQAITSLQLIGALETGGPAALTALGQHLTRMPTDPRIAKMLLYGALLHCLDPVLTIAAAQGFGRPVFFSPPDKREEAEAAKRALVSHVAGSKSDHLAVVAAYNNWRAAVLEGGHSAGREFCASNFVSDQAMDSIDAGRRQYADILLDLGFIPNRYPACVADVRREGGLRELVPHELDAFSDQARIVKAALCAGFYPQVLRVEHPPAKYQQTHGGTFQVDHDPKSLRFFDRTRGRVFLHPSSLNFTCGRYESGWLVYSELVQTSKVFVRESSMVPVYSLLLFGGELGVQHEAGTISVDGWARFKAPAKIAVLVRELRREVAALLDRKIRDPGLDLSGSRVVEAMQHLLSSDGF